jgi:hypothetical protein
MENFYDIAKKYGTDKVTHHGYHLYYPLYLDPLRQEKFKMLEIGFEIGRSAKMWCEYFPFSEIYCMDINIMDNIIDGCTIIKGDQGNRDDLKKVVDLVKNAKFIIDDGSHYPVHQIDTFEYLFTNLLEPGGIYIIEDIETNYWAKDADVYGYIIGYFNSIDYSTKYINQINGEFSGIKNNLKISSITYAQNCIIIKKQTDKEIEYFNRPYRYTHKILN